MKKVFLTLFSTILTISLFGQIKNAAFEIKRDTLLPSDWNLVPVKGFSAMLVNDVKYEEQYAMKISSAESNLYEVGVFVANEDECS